MRKLFTIVLLVLTVLIANAQTQGFVEGQITTTPEVMKYKMIANVHSGLTDHIGINVFALASPAWGQIVVGPTYTKANSTGLFRVSAGIGIQVDTASPFYSNAYVLFVENKFSFFAKGEIDLKGNWWYTTSAEYALTPWYSIGIQSEKYGITGMKNVFSKGRLSFWTTFGYKIDVKAWGVQSGLRLRL